MTERPILFSAPMIRALLDGRKTQTRRIMKFANWQGAPANYLGANGNGDHVFTPTERWGGQARCPYGVPGDLLWVREQFSGPYTYSALKPRDWLESAWGADPEHPGERPAIWYWADGQPSDGDWTRPKPSIHMPRWASRISLRVTDVRVERLNEISARDALAEGLTWVVPGKWSVDHTLPIIGDDPRRVYRHLWEHINGPGSWAANPWVWAVSFERIEGAAADV